MERPHPSKPLSQESRAVHKLEDNVDRSAQIDPELKSWLDRVIVPAMVRDFLEQAKQKNGIASPPEIGIDSQRTLESFPEEHS